MSTEDPKRAEEVCHYCDGDGCEACNDTGLLYTQEAIRLQLEDADAEARRAFIIQMQDEGFDCRTAFQLYDMRNIAEPISYDDFRELWQQHAKEDA